MSEVTITSILFIAAAKDSLTSRKYAYEGMAPQGKETDVGDNDQSSLIVALKLRDRFAWCVAVDRHFREVYGFVFHLVGSDRSVAEDLNQETWLEAVDGIQRCDEANGSFRNWLFGIARRRVAIYFRRRASAGNSTLLDNQCGEVAELANRSVMPVDVLEQVERSNVVRAAMLVLPDERREVLLSKYVEGLPVKTIAIRMGKTVKAVESLLSRSREQLRELLGGYMMPCGDERQVRKELSNE
jgi:RNA polymerase sigma-70 factor (ECF subfamily)